MFDKKLAVHLVILFAVALTARMFMAHVNSIRDGMTWGYQNSAYMLSAGYGFKRSAGEYGVNGLNEYSRQLAAKGEKITVQNRPQLDQQELRPVQHRLPGYPALMLVAYTLFGEPLDYWTGMVQAVITALYPLLVFAIAVRLFEDRTYSWIAAWISALYPPFIFLSVHPLPIALVTGFVLLAMYFFICGAFGRNNWCMLITGVMIGAGCYFKPTIFYLWIFLGLALFVIEKAWKRPAVATALMMIGTYLTLFPWAYRNYTYSDEFIWGSTITWCSIWKDVGANPNPWGVVLLDEYGREFAQRHGFEDDLTPEACAFFKKLVLSYAKEDPFFFVRATLKRLPTVIAAPFCPGFTNPNRDKGLIAHYLNKENKDYLHVIRHNSGYVLRAYWERILVAIVSLAGSMSLLLLVITSRENRSQAIFLSSIAAYFICVHAPFITGARYLMPMIPCQIIAMVFFTKWLKQRLCKST